MRARKAPSGPNIDLASFPQTVFHLEVGSTLTIDWSDGPVQYVLLSGNCTITSIGLPAGETAEVTLIVKQPPSGGPALLTFVGGLVATGTLLSTTANAIDLLDLLWQNASLFVTTRGKAFS